MCALIATLPSLLSPIERRSHTRQNTVVCGGWTPSHTSSRCRSLHAPAVNAVPLESIHAAISTHSSPQVLYTLAGIDAQTAGLLKTILGPLLSIGQVFMIVRIVLTWYPEIDQERLPWLVVCAPTEPILGPTRRVIPPAFGVDVSPVVWVAVFSFVNEVLLGPQGILSLIERKG